MISYISKLYNTLYNFIDDKLVGRFLNYKKSILIVIFCLVLCLTYLIWSILTNESSVFFKSIAIVGSFFASMMIKVLYELYLCDEQTQKNDFNSKLTIELITSLNNKQIVDTREKIIIREKFYKMPVYRACEEYFKEFIPNLDAYSFVKDCLGYSKEVSEEEIEKRKLKVEGKVILGTLDKLELIDLIHFIGHLTKRGIILDDTRRYRSIARCLKVNYPFSAFSEENIRKLYAEERTKMPEKVKNNLNSILNKNKL